MSSESPILQRLKSIEDSIVQENVIPQGTIDLIALHLSRTNIPTNLHSTPLPTEVESVTAAIFAMDVFSACSSLDDSQVEPSVLISIWRNGLSDWIQFLLSEFVEKTTSYPHDFVVAAVVRMRLLLSILCHIPEARQAVSDTPAIVAMMTKMWLREGNPESFFIGFTPSNSFRDDLRHFPFASVLDRTTGVYAGAEDDPLKFARVAVDVIDGGFNAIADAGIEGLRTCISRPDLSFQNVEAIRAQSSLLWKLTVFAQLESGACVPHEFATVSVKILSVLLLRPEGRRTPIVDVLNLLVSTIRRGCPIQTIAKALESGLMAVLISLAQYVHPDVEMSALVSDLIEKDIAPCLVYRSVLKSVGNLKSVYVKRSIDESVRYAWLSFKDLVSDRKCMRRDFDGRPCAVKNCIASAALQCSGCQVTRYCSRACQKRNWSAHREYCHSIVESNKGNMPLGQVISAVDEDFIQCIMLDDVQRHWPQIRSELKIDPETGLATNAIMVKLDYRSTASVKVKIVSIESTVITGFQRGVDVTDFCQAMMVDARVRHPTQKGTFSVSKIYPVSAMEEIYVMEKEDEENDAMSIESDCESDYESDD